MTATPQASSEVELFNEGRVRITSARAVIGNQTYAMSNITSVATHEISPSRAPAFVLILLGVVFVACTLGGDSALNLGSAVGGVIALAGVGLLFVGKPSYAVRIGSASGESNALQSPNRDEIQRIVDALNDAIVRRG